MESFNSNKQTKTTTQTSQKAQNFDPSNFCDILKAAAYSFNQNIIQNNIPYTLTTEFSEGGFISHLTLFNQVFVTSPFPRKKTAETTAKGLALIRTYSSSRNITKTLVNPQMDEKDAHDALETLTVDRAAKTVLVHQRDESVARFAELATQFQGQTAFGDLANAFNALTNRWNTIDTGKISTSDPMGKIIKKYDFPIDVVKVLKSNPTFLPFLNYAFIRPEMEIRIVLNSTKFHQGIFILAAKYGENLTRLSSGVERIDHAVQLVQMNHCLLNAATANIGVLELPFISHFDMISSNLQGSISPLYYSSVYFGVLAPLQTGVDTMPDVSYTVYARFLPTSKFFGQRTMVPPLLLPSKDRAMTVKNSTGQQIAIRSYKLDGTQGSVSGTIDNGQMFDVKNEDEDTIILGAAPTVADLPATVDTKLLEDDSDYLFNFFNKTINVTYRSETINQAVPIASQAFQEFDYLPYKYMLDIYVATSVCPCIVNPQGSVQSAVIDSVYDKQPKYRETAGGRQVEANYTELRESAKASAAQGYHELTDWMDYALMFIPGTQAVSLAKTVFDDTMGPEGFQPGNLALDLGKAAVIQHGKNVLSEQFPNFKHPVTDTMERTRNAFNDISMGVNVTESLAHNFGLGMLVDPQSDESPMLGTTESSIPPEHRSAWRDSHPESGVNEITTRPWLSNAKSSQSSYFAHLNCDNPTLPIDPLPAMLHSTPSLSRGSGPQFYRKLKLDHITTDTHPICDVPVEKENHFSFNYLKSINSLVGSFKLTSNNKPGDLLFITPITPNLGFFKQQQDKGLAIIPSTIAVLSANFAMRSGDLEFTFMAAKTPIHSFRLSVVTSPDIIPMMSTQEDFPKSIYDYEEENTHTTTAPYYAPTKIAPIWQTTIPSARNRRGVFFGYLAVYLNSEFVNMSSVADNVDILVFVRGASNFMLHVPMPPRLLYSNNPTVRNQRNRRQRIVSPQMEERNTVETNFSATIPARPLASILHSSEQIDLESYCRRSNLVWNGVVDFTKPIAYAEYDNNFTPFTVAEDGKPYQIMNQMADAFIFSRGSIRYVLSVNCDSVVQVRVIHYPFTIDYRDKFNFSFVDSYTEDSVGTNLASEICHTGQQAVLPYEVPYVQPLNMTLNGGDPTIDGVYGTSTQANGVTRIILSSVVGAKASVQLYSLMGDDTRMYTFQGFPPMRYEQTQLSTQYHLCIPYSTNGVGTIVNPQCDEEDLDTDASFFQRTETDKDNLLNCLEQTLEYYKQERQFNHFLYKEIKQQIRKRKQYLKKNSFNKQARKMEIRMRRLNIAEPQGEDNEMSTFRKLINAPFNFSNVVADARDVVSECKSRMPDVADGITSATSTLKTAGENASNLFSMINSNLTSLIDKMSSSVKSFSEGAFSINAVSTLVHLWNVFKSSSIVEKLVNFGGFLASIGINIFSSVSDFVPKVLALFKSETVVTPQDDSEPDCVDSSISYLKILFPVITALIGFKSCKVNDNIFKKFSVLFKDFFWMTNQFDRFITSNLNAIKAFVYYCLGIENPQVIALNNIKKTSDEISTWAARVLELSDVTYTAQIESNPLIQKEIVELWEQGNKYVTLPIEKPELRKISASITLIFKKCVDLYNKLSAKVVSGYSIEPISYWFFGNAGVGKSRLQDPIIEKLGKAMRIVHNGTCKFVRNPADKYWSGYADQPFVVFDDWGQIKDPTVMVALLMDWWGLCTCANYTANFAELSDKGRNVQPACILSFSNVAYPNTSIVTDKTALWRRRDKLIEVQLSEAFTKKYPCQHVINAQFMNENPSAAKMISKFDHLSFIFCDPLDPTAAKSKPMSYSEMVSALAKHSAATYKTRKDECIKNFAKGNPLAADAWMELIADSALHESVGGETPEIKEFKDTVIPEIKDNAKVASESLVDRLEHRTTGKALNVSTLLAACDIVQPQDETEEFEDTSENNFDSTTDGMARALQCQKMIQYKLDKISCVDNNCNCQDNKLIKSCLDESLANLTPVRCIHKRFDFDSGLICQEHEIMTDIDGAPIGETLVNIPWAPCGALDCVLRTSVEADEYFIQMRSDNIFRAGAGDKLAINVSNMNKKFYCCKGVNVDDNMLYKRLMSCLNVIKNTTYDILKYLTKTACIILATITVATALSSLYKLLFGSYMSTENSLKVAGCGVSIYRGMGAVRPQLSSSGDVKTSQSSLARGRLINPQGDNSALIKLVKRNSFFLFGKTSQNKLRNIRGLGLCDRYAVVPRHFFTNLDCSSIHAKMYNGGVVEIEVEALDIKYLGNYDLCVIKFPVKLPAFKTITHLLPSEAEIDTICTNALIPEIPKDDSAILLHSIDIKFISRIVTYPCADGTFVDREIHGMRYNKQAKGFCGNVLLDPIHNRIFGMHIFELDGLGHGNFLCRDWFSDLDCNIKDVIEPEQDFVGTKVPLDGDFIPISSLAECQMVSQPVLSSIIPSEAYGVLAEPSREPVKFTSPGEAKPGFKALAAGMNKHIPTRPFKISHIKKVTEFMTEEMINKCPPIIKPKSARSLADAVSGVNGVPFMDAMRLNTSPGYPLNHEFRGKKKKDFIKVNSEKEITIHPKVLNSYLKEHAERADGILPYCPYFNFLKDERLRPGKDARLINGCCLTETMEWRRYCMDFFAAFQKAGLNVGCGIGMNVRSGAWTNLADKLLEKGDCILSADYKSFGNTNDPQIVDQIRQVILEWYHFYTELGYEDQQIRYMLFESLCFVKNVVGDCVVTTLQGFPSGNPYTAPINTLVNKFYMYLAWLDAFSGTNIESLDNFEKYVYFCFYGDDLIASVHPSLIKYFNNKTIAQFMTDHGITMTDSRKRNEIVEFDKLTDASFLKCDFVPHPTRPGFFLAALEKKVIEDIPSWIRKPCPDVREQTLINCEQAVMFAHGWGPDYFKQVRGKLQSFFRDRGIDFRPRNWNDYDELCFNSNFETYNLNNDPLQEFLSSQNYM